LAAAAPAGGVGSARTRASAQKKESVETSGDFRGDDDSLFGDNTFDDAQASPGQPMQYQADAGDDCVDEQGREVTCDNDDSNWDCVDAKGDSLNCDKPEEEPEPKKLAEPSDFLQGIVKAVSAEEMPAKASRVLKKSVKSIMGAKLELKEAAKLKAGASIDEKRAKGLEDRVAELEEYQHEKQKFADAAEELAHKANDEYDAEEEQVKEMNEEEDSEEKVERKQQGVGVKSGGEALRHRLQQHLPLLRVVDKLAQRVGAVKGRGRHPRSRHDLPRKVPVN